MRSVRRERESLNIAIVTPTIAKEGTGPSICVSALSKQLLDVGHSVTVVTGNYGGSQIPHDQVQIDARATVKSFPASSGVARRLYRSSAMRRWMDQQAHSFDVVDIQGIWSFIAVDAARACMRARTPYVITTHGQMARWDWKKHWLRKQAFYHLFLRCPWRLAAAVRFLSERERSVSVDKALRNGVVVPNWVERGAERPSETKVARMRADLGIPADSRVLLFLGRITDQKGVVEIIRAFKELCRRRSDCVLLLVGPMDPEYRTDLEQELVDARNQRRIIVSQPIYDERKSALFSLATLFITLSKNEGLPLAVLEALANGVPAVVTDKANLPEIVEYDAGVVVPPDPACVGEQVDRLLSQPTRICSMSQSARRLIEERFSVDVVFPQLLSVYREALSARLGV